MAASVGVVATFLAPSAFADPGYATQSSITYEFTYPSRMAVDYCTGTAFIGQLTTNSIEAFTETICTGNNLISNTETRIKSSPDTLQTLAKNGAVNSDPPARYVTAAASVRGGPPGTQYCVFGIGASSNGLVSVGGSGTTCIITR